MTTIGENSELNLNKPFFMCSPDTFWEMLLNPASNDKF